MLAKTARPSPSHQTSSPPVVRWRDSPGAAGWASSTHSPTRTGPIRARRSPRRGWNVQPAKEELQPIAFGGRTVTEIARPSSDYVDAYIATTLRRFGLSRCLPRVERSARVSDYNANAFRLDREVQRDFVLFLQAAMVIEVRDQLLDDDTEPRLFILVQPLGLPKLSCSLNRLDDGASTAQATGQVLRI